MPLLTRASRGLLWQPTTSARCTHSPARASAPCSFRRSTLRASWQSLLVRARIPSWPQPLQMALSSSTTPQCLVSSALPRRRRPAPGARPRWQRPMTHARVSLLHPRRLRRKAVPLRPRNLLSLHKVRSLPLQVARRQAGPGVLCQEPLLGTLRAMELPFAPRRASASLWIASSPRRWRATLARPPLLLWVWTCTRGARNPSSSSRMRRGL
mmetsp:Transcript_19367/g.61462  ORF Transcript_19367/g.61462 Transcript_19367/m.61462 type:complete len:211 (+) Transcript_19367:422-1054(+)